MYKIEKFSEDYLDELRNHGIDEETISKLERMRGITINGYSTDTSSKDRIDMTINFTYDEFV